MFAALFIANALVLAGLIALVFGTGLVVVGVPVAWLARAGAMVALIGFAGRYLLARRVRSALNHLAEEGLTTIYMPLLNAGTDVWRPVEAMKIGEHGYMVTQHRPSEEEWAFQPGQILRCEQRELSGSTHLVAVAKGT